MRPDQVTDRLLALSQILLSLKEDVDGELIKKIKVDIDKLLDLCKI